MAARFAAASQSPWTDTKALSIGCISGSRSAASGYSSGIDGSTVPVITAATTLSGATGVGTAYSLSPGGGVMSSPVAIPSIGSGAGTSDASWIDSEATGPSNRSTSSARRSGADGKSVGAGRTSCSCAIFVRADSATSSVAWAIATGSDEPGNWTVGAPRNWRANTPRKITSASASTTFSITPSIAFKPLVFIDAPCAGQA